MADEIIRFDDSAGRLVSWLEDAIERENLAGTHEVAGWLEQVVGSEELASFDRSLVEVAAVTGRLQNASVGQCRICGHALRMQGGQEVLEVCCTNSPSHCWQIGTRSS